jgi:DDE superfamily endonuclease
MNKDLLELYSDYLLSSFTHTTATGLSRMSAGEVSHDKITRFLASEEMDSRALWRLVKPLARQVQGEDGVLIIDDTIEEKPYTDESELVCWHYDHSKGRSVKGINLISALYHVEGAWRDGFWREGACVPVAFELVKKSEWIFDQKKEKWRRRSPETKNEAYRRMLSACKDNRLKFRYVLSDVFYSASENMSHIKEELKREFIMALKSNRKVALWLEDKQKGVYERVGSLKLEPGAVVEVHLEQVRFPLFVLKQVFTNEDGSTGVLYLASSDPTLDYERMSTIYHRRWKVEEYHKSLKSNASLAKSPTKTTRTQSNHIFCSIHAFVKLERMRMATKLNHFALRSRLCVKAVQAACQELHRLQLADDEPMSA